jgi:hypothetical protein
MKCVNGVRKPLLGNGIILSLGAPCTTKSIILSIICATFARSAMGAAS